ncbi:single-stranded-DNA-specific exonuclease RecJ [Candidatus Margulisiibacteriota bacterium]
MSLTGKKWQLYKPEKESSKRLAEETKTSPITSQILINRGISTASDAGDFLNPKLASLFDPSDIPGMQEATERVKLAEKRGEKVAVYGDYDVDGVTGTSIMLITLKNLGIQATYYIPHRYDEGYGMNIDAVSKLNSEGVKLIITVDCGISNLAEIEHANSLGIDVIVTDHHNPPKILPKALAIIDPKLMSKEHRSRELSGAGVAFKFAWGLYRAFGIKDSRDLISMLDLAGLGTIADIVPLIDENRILAVYGVKSLNENPRPGIKALIDAARIKKRITTNSVNFMISPRINAAGRLEHARLSVELLTSDDPDKVKELANTLSKVNTKRQEIGNEIKESAFSKIDESDLPKLVMIEGEGWHPGVIGIVASRIVDKFYCPAILIGVNNGIGRGSARSVDGLDIYEVLEKCKDLFIDFGGHKKAAGFEIDKDNIPELQKRVKKIVAEMLPSDDLMPKLLIDTEVSAGQINMSLATEIQSLGPFGEGNPVPLLLTRKLKLLEQRRVGNGSHLKARFTDGKVTLEAIGFGLGDMEDQIRFGHDYDIVYNLEVNEFNGFETAQLKLVDISDQNN